MTVAPAASQLAGHEASKLLPALGDDRPITVESQVKTLADQAEEVIPLALVPWKFCTAVALVNSA